MESGFSLIITPLFLSIIISLPIFYQHFENMKRIELLDNLPNNLKELDSFKSARFSLERRMIHRKKLLYIIVPIIILFIYVFIYFYESLYGLLHCDSFMCDFSEMYKKWMEEPNIMLGGVFADIKDKDSIFKYQLITATCAGIALTLCYVLVLYDIVILVNQNEATPFVYWFSLMKMIIAPMLAAVLRHFSDGGSVGIATVGVLSAVLAYGGTKYITETFHEILAKTPFGKSFTIRNMAKVEHIPDAMPLCMVDGMNEQVQSKFNQIGIQDCSGLAGKNILLIWVMTRFSLIQVCDWVDQALLVVHARPEGKSKLLKYGIRDLSCLSEFINKNKTAEKSPFPDFDLAYVAGLECSIAQDSQFKSLKEIRGAL